MNLCIIYKPNKHLTKWQTGGQTDKTAYYNFIELLFPFRLNGFNDVENNWIYFLFWPKFVAVRYAWKTPTHTPSLKLSQWNFFDIWYSWKYAFFFFRLRVASQSRQHFLKLDFLRILYIWIVYSVFGLFVEWGRRACYFFIISYNDILIKSSIFC